jgi:hypothetical protein
MALSDYDPIFEAAGKEWNIDPLLLKSVARQESGGNTKAVSKANAQGLMQIIPETQKYLGITDPNDPTQSIFGAAKYLSEGLDKEGTPEGALLFYHGGPGWRDAYGPESKGYVPAVTAHYQKFASAQRPAAPSAPDAPDASHSAMSDDDFLKSTGGTAGDKHAEDDAAFLTRTGGKAAEVAAPAGEPSIDPITGFPVDAAGKPVPGAQSTAGPQSTVSPGSASSAGNIVNAGIQGIKEGFGTAPIGMSPQTDQALVNAGVFNGPNEYNPLKGINRAIITPLAAGADLAVRGGSAVLRGGQGIVAQTGAELGAPSLGRDLAAIPEAFMGDIGTLHTSGAEPAAVRGAAPPIREPYAVTAQNALQAAPPVLRAPANDVFANPLVRSPEAVSAPSFVPPGAQIPAPTASATRPSFVPPEPTAPAPATRTAANDAPNVSPSGRAPANDTVNPLNPQAPTATPTVNPLSTAPASSRTVPSVDDVPATSRAVVEAPKAETGSAKVDQAAQAKVERNRLLAPAKTGGDATPYVPGVRLTQADITGNAVDATEAKRLSQTPEGTQQFRDLQSDNSAARSAYFDQIAGDPSDVASLKAARSGQAEQDLQAAWENKQKANAQPVVETINRILKSDDGVRPLVQQKLNQVLETLHDKSGALQTDPEMLYGARKAIDDTLSKEAAKSEPLNIRVASNLQNVKAALDRAIEPAAPGFGQYLKNFSEASRPIDKMELLQSFQPKLTNGADRNMTFGKFDAMMKNIVQERATRGNSPAKSIDPDTMDALFNLHADLRRAAHTDALAAVKGSDTSQMLDYGKKLAGKGLETALAVKTAGASIPLVHGAKTYLANRNLKKSIRNHLYPDVDKLLKKKNPLSTTEDAP